MVNIVDKGFNGFRFGFEYIGADEKVDKEYSEQTIECETGQTYGH